MKHWHNVCMVNRIYIDKMFAWDLKMCIHTRIAIWIFFWEYTIEISEGFVRRVSARRKNKHVYRDWCDMKTNIHSTQDGYSTLVTLFHIGKNSEKNSWIVTQRSFFNSLNQRQLIHSCSLELLKEPAWKVDPKLTQSGLILTNQKKGSKCSPEWTGLSTCIICFIAKLSYIQDIMDVLLGTWYLKQQSYCHIHNWEESKTKQMDHTGNIATLCCIIQTSNIIIWPELFSASLMINVGCFGAWA